MPRRRNNFDPTTSLLVKLNYHVVNLNLSMVLTIPEMHQHLDSLNQFFSQKTSSFITLISSHPGRLTADDYSHFADLIEEIRNDALTRIT
jgi:hypothetical protein